MAYVFKVLQQIGDVAPTIDATLSITKLVDVSQIITSGSKTDIDNPLTGDTYKTLRTQISRANVDRILSNNPQTYDIGNGGAASTATPQITTLTNDSGIYWYCDAHIVAGTQNRISLSRSIKWGGQTVNSLSESYTVNASKPNVTLIFVITTIESGNNAGTYFFVIYDTHKNESMYSWGVETSAIEVETQPLPQTPTGGAGGFGNRDNRTDVTVNIGTKPSSFLSGILGGSGFNFYYVPSYHDLIRAAYYSLNGVNNLSDFVNNTAALFLNPATYIVSAVQIPIDKSAFGAGGLRHDIRLGGLVNFNVDCYNLTKLWGDSETFTFPFNGMYFDSFMDFEPYTKISLLLPYVGVVPLKCSECVGGSVSVKYRFEGLTGKCIAFVYTTDRNGRNTGYYQYSGDAGFSVPWVGNNGGGSQMIHSAASAAISLASGTADLSTVGDLAQTAASFYGSDSRPKMQGGFGVNTGVLGADDIAIFVQRAQNAMPEHYYDIHGYQTATGGVVGDYSGYTQFVYVDLENTTATDSEKAEIESLLKGGVFL